MNKLKIFIGIALVFIVGALSGTIGTGVYVRYKIDNYVKNGHPSMKYYLINYVIPELDLSKGQKIEIEKIVAEIQNKFNKLKADHYPEAQNIMEEGYKKMTIHLNSIQKKKLDNIAIKLKQNIVNKT